MYPAIPLPVMTARSCNRSAALKVPVFAKTFGGSVQVLAHFERDWQSACSR